MNYKWFTSLFLLIVCSFAAYSQGNETKKNQKPAEKQSEKNKYVKEQAVLLLETVLLDSKSIKNFRQKTEVIAEASAALWTYNRSLAEDSLLSFINQSLADYKELLAKENKSDEEDSKLHDLSDAIKKSLKSLAGKDVEKAKLLQNKFFEIRQQSLEGKKLNESLELASEGLEFDEPRTLALLSAVLQQGVPSQFPKFIFELKEKNPNAADLLTRKAIDNLAVNPNYKALDAIYLSVIIFNETGILIPSLKDNTKPNEFFVFTSFVGESKRPSSRENISAYFSSAQNFFRGRLQNQSNGFFGSPQNLIRVYFLIEKLKSYNQVYKLNNSEPLNDISIPIIPLMEIAGFSEKTLTDVRGFARRLADSNNPLALDDGTNLLEKADNAKNPEEKLDYLIRGIIQLIEFKKFAEAERRIFDVENTEIRDSLYLLLNQRAGLEAAKNKNWDEFENRTEKITEKSFKAFLYLKAVSILEYKNNTILFSEFVIKAEKNVKDISDKNAKASAYMLLALLVAPLNQASWIQITPSAIKAVNEAAGYDEDEFEIVVKIPTRQTYFASALGANSYRNFFRQLAEHNWDDSQIEALQIKSKGLQSIAQIVTAQAVLQKKKLSK